MITSQALKKFLLLLKDNKINDDDFKKVIDTIYPSDEFGKTFEVIEDIVKEYINELE